MFERSEPALKAICVALAALLLFQFGRLVVRSNPLAHLVIPQLPSLPPETNAPAGARDSVAGGAEAKIATNIARLGTNAASGRTNSSKERESRKGATEALHAVPGKSHTNSNPALASTEVSTNFLAEARPGSKETNTLARSVSTKTNMALPSDSAKPGAVAGSLPGMAGMGPQGRTKAPDLPLPILARVDRITDSEILGPVIRPLPMALLGIAGNVAFLRTTDGQTGLVKEGDSLGALKLIRIGINRVLVEEEGQQQELTIFSGYGGESLLAKQKEKTK